VPLPAAKLLWLVDDELAAFLSHPQNVKQLKFHSAQYVLPSWRALMRNHLVGSIEQCRLIRTPHLFFGHIIPASACSVAQQKIACIVTRPRAAKHI
jgi:hypothetical protein